MKALLCAVVLGCAGCGGRVPAVTPADATRAGVPFETLSTGRQTYLDTCGGCHALWAPGSRTREHWAQKLPAMAARAHLDGPRSQALGAFLRTFAGP